MSRLHVGLRAILFVILSHLIIPVTPLFSQSFTPVVQLVHPLENSEIISKKLAIEGRLQGPIDPKSFIIFLDGMDLTGIVNIDEGCFSCKLIDIFPSGEHSIYIAIQSGNELFKKEIFFSSRHHTNFEEFYGNNELSLNYGATLSRSAPLDTDNSDNTYLQNITPLGNTSATPYSKLDSYLESLVNRCENLSFEQSKQSTLDGEEHDKVICESTLNLVLHSCQWHRIYPSRCSICTWRTKYSSTIGTANLLC